MGRSDDGEMAAMKIAILLYDGVTALDAVGPYEVLSRLPGAELGFVAKSKGPQRTDTKCLALVADYELGEIRQPDILLVPGGTVGTLQAAEDPDILDWVKRAHETSQWTTSVCTGALILGAAGILRDLEATTHWCFKDDLERFGAVYASDRVVRRGKVITSAGVSAGIDMALTLAGEIAGVQFAQMMQLVLEYDPQPPFDAGSPAKAPAGVVAAVEQEVARLIKA